MFMSGEVLCLFINHLNRNCWACNASVIDAVTNIQPRTIVHKKLTYSDWKCVTLFSSLKIGILNEKPYVKSKTEQYWTIFQVLTISGLNRKVWEARSRTDITTTTFFLVYIIYIYIYCWLAIMPSRMAAGRVLLVIVARKRPWLTNGSRRIRCMYFEEFAQRPFLGPSLYLGWTCIKPPKSQTLNTVYTLPIIVYIYIRV